MVSESSHTVKARTCTRRLCITVSTLPLSGKVTTSFPHRSRLCTAFSAHCNVHLSCKIHTSWQCLQKKQSTPGACNSKQICDRQGSSLCVKRKVHLKIKCFHHLLTSMSGYQHSSKYLLHKQNKQNSYRFGTT